ncbi:uncharacterized protein N7459_006199 [Penicillium hispanicum]|uniref:uncharacterized protein n=1 Tax=Penicillium hispanicum TaxID=1080232 RepID=UPI00254041E2|nr:uncharacterized protein N7459_006199 [Penicillium hispanicum]KAJ5580214.1 hypothetical protein N7459_006199 [Penicillium hispanicum]
MQFRFNVKKCTFNDVMVELAQARDIYEDNAQGWNFWRQGLRTAGDYADEITPWFDLIPSDHGLNFLSAGLKIIFGIAQQNASNRANILGAFQDIPELMLTAKDQQGQWKAKKLQKTAIELYNTLARALARLIFILNGSMRPHPSLSERANKFIKRLVASGYTAKVIDGILAGVQKQAKRFENCLQQVRDDLAIKTGADAAAAKEIADRTENKVDDIGEALQGYDTNISELKKDIQREGKGIYILNVIHQTLVCTQPNVSADNVRSQSPPQSNHSRALMSVTELFNSLGVSLESLSRDLKMAIKDLSQSNNSDQAQAQQFFSSHQFTEWMASRDTATLLVHGNFDTPGPGRITTLSVLCAMFVLHLHGNDNYIVLHYFCGLHGTLYQADSVAGPNGLIRSLIAQMLCTRHKFDLEFINTPWFAQSIQTHSLSMLCHTFSQLVEQLPRDTVILCILDGVTEFESEQWWADFRDVLDALNRLGTDPESRPIFKPLLTTPFARGLIDFNLQARYSLTLQPTGSVDGYGFSERSMPHELSQASRLDYFNMRMQMNRADDEDSYDSDDDSD